MSAPNPECLGCQALQAEIVTLRAELGTLQATVADLSARLQQHSGNSSRPPSSDPPSAPKRPTPRTPSGRKKGGQPGHRGVTRALLPEDQVQAVRTYAPTTCTGCHAALTDQSALPTPRRHQVWELPPLTPHVTEHQLHARDCPQCGTRTWATLPTAVPTRLVGPRLQAFCALLTGRFRLGRRPALELLEDAFGLTLSLGTLAALEAEVAAALRPSATEVATALAQAESLNADETGWKERGQRRWLWLAATPTLAYFRLLDRRNRAAFEELLPLTAASIVTSDRFGAYTRLPLSRRQLCWAHLVRDFQALSERTGPARTIGHWALDQSRRLFTHWHAFRQGTLTRPALGVRMQPVQRAFRTLLAWGQTLPGQAGALCRDLEAKWEALWTFLVHAGVEPTNNHAERLLRPAVLWRKTSFGHQSESGKHYVERMLTVVSTLRLQGRSVLGYLEQVLQATRMAAPTPSLLPPA